MTSPKPRLGPRAAVLTIAAIAACGMAGFALAQPVADTSRSAPGHGHPTGGSTGDEPGHAPTEGGVTAEEQARADELVAETKDVIARYAAVSIAEADGYRWIGDGEAPGQYRHYVQPLYLLDGAVLDPSSVESLVYRTEADGSLTLVSGMYILPLGSTMAEVPDVAGELTRWHDHADLCWNRDGTISGTAQAGTCPDGSTARATPPMLHVWIVDNPKGPFAGIEGHDGAG